MVQRMHGYSRMIQNILDLLSTFYAKFYVFETILKEHILQQFEYQYGADWLNYLHSINLFQLESVAIANRKKHDFRISTRLFINEASFGFWVELFGRETYKQLKGVPIKAFSELPSEIKRRHLYQMLSNIKEVRNKLYHHRIDLFNNISKKEIDLLSKTDKDLYLIISWIDKHAIQLIRKDDFQYHLSKVLPSK